MMFLDKIYFYFYRLTRGAKPIHPLEIFNTWLKTALQCSHKGTCLKAYLHGTTLSHATKSYRVNRPLACHDPITLCIRKLELTLETKLMHPANSKVAAILMISFNTL